MCVVIIAMVSWAIVSGISSQAGVSTYLMPLTCYEEFRHLYDVFRRAPSTKNGEQLYHYYHSFRTHRTKEDKVMSDTMQRCTSILIKLGVIHT